MSDFEKKSLNFDFLLKMLEGCETPPARLIESPKTLVPPKPQPTTLMQSYNCSLKPGECIVDRELLSVNGWLQPDGILLACGWQQHTKTINSLNFTTERDAIMAGYVKLSTMVWQIGRQYTKIVLTDEQSNTIRDWHVRNAISDAYYQYQLSKLKD